MTINGITQKSLDEACDLLEYNELLTQDALIPRATMNSQDFIDICSSMRTYHKELDVLCSLDANVRSTVSALATYPIVYLITDRHTPQYYFRYTTLLR
jgi:hypothetical protein